MNAIAFVKSLRLPECVLVVLLCYLGFLSASIQVELGVITALFFITASTMLQNDWRDRYHDIGKGKFIASEKPRLYFSILTLCWIFSLALIVIIASANTLGGCMLLGIACIGLIYSETRKLPFVPILLVTATVSSVTLVPLAFGASFISVAPLFVATALIMFGRENLHDIADQEVDRGYKKTIPVVLGSRFARGASVVTLVLGCVVAYFITPLSLLGSIPIVIGLLGINKDRLVKLVRKWCDAGLVLLVLSLLLFFP